MSALLILACGVIVALAFFAYDLLRENREATELAEHYQNDARESDEALRNLANQRDAVQAKYDDLCARLEARASSEIHLHKRVRARS